MSVSTNVPCGHAHASPSPQASALSSPALLTLASLFLSRCCFSFTPPLLSECLGVFACALRSSQHWPMCKYNNHILGKCLTPAPCRCVYLPTSIVFRSLAFVVHLTLVFLHLLCHYHFFNFNLSETNFQFKDFNISSNSFHFKIIVTN